MPRIESQPIPKQETILEKAGKFFLKVLGIGVLIGAAYAGLKEVVIPGLKGLISKTKNFVKS